MERLSYLLTVTELINAGAETQTLSFGSKVHLLVIVLSTKRSLRSSAKLASVLSHCKGKSLGSKHLPSSPLRFTIATLGHQCSTSVYQYSHVWVL